LTILTAALALTLLPPSTGTWGGLRPAISSWGGPLRAAILVQQQPHQPGAPETDETVAVQKGARLVVNNFAGEVVVHTWDRDSVHVTARHRTRTKVNIRQTASGLTISASGTMGPASSVDYDITAPAWMPVRVEGTYNFVTVEGAQAEVSAESVRGDIVVKGGAGFVTAKSIQGEIVVEGSRGRIAAQSVNEAIRITDSTGEITAESTNGAITMTRCSAQSVDASTVNGDITYDGSLAASGHYQFSTHNGDVSLSIPEGANATFTVRTYNGEFRSDLPLKGASPEDLRRGRRVQMTLGSGAADVNIESFGGSIRIRKAGSPERK
jgi:hypothetical protein